MELLLSYEVSPWRSEQRASDHGAIYPCARRDFGFLINLINARCDAGIIIIRLDGE